MLIHNTRRGNYNGIIRGVIAAAILFIILTIGTVREGITRALFAVAAPAWRAEQEASGEVGGWLSFFRSRNALVAAYAALEEKNRALTAELFAVSVFKKENEELNEVLARRQFALPFLVARVLVHPGRSPYNTLIIDRGEKDGIKTGAIATLYGDIAIGAVERVTGTSAIIKLFSSPGEKRDVFLNEGNVPLSAEGTGGGNFKARAPKGISVKEGDSVVDPSLPVPLIGVVGAVETSSSDAFQDIVFQAPLNLYEIQWVEVLVNSGYIEEGVKTSP